MIKGGVRGVKSLLLCCVYVLLTCFTVYKCSCDPAFRLSGMDWMTESLQAASYYVNVSTWSIDFIYSNSHNIISAIETSVHAFLFFYLHLSKQGCCAWCLGNLTGWMMQDKWLRYEGGLRGPVMAGWFSYNPIEQAGETRWGRHRVLAARQPVYSHLPLHLCVLADYSQ